MTLFLGPPVDPLRRTRRGKPRAGQTFRDPLIRTTLCGAPISLPHLRNLQCGDRLGETPLRETPGGQNFWDPPCVTPSLLTHLVHSLLRHRLGKPPCGTSLGGPLLRAPLFQTHWKYHLGKPGANRHWKSLLGGPPFQGPPLGEPLGSTIGDPSWWTPLWDQLVGLTG